MSHTPSSLLQPTFQTISMHVELSLEVHLFWPQQPQKCNSSCQTMLIAPEFFWAFFRLLPSQHSLSSPHPASMAQQILWKNGLRSQSCSAPQRAWRSSWRLRTYFAMPASELIPRTWAWWNSRETMENQQANCWPKLLKLNSPGSLEETPTAFKSMYQHGLLTCHWHAFKKPLDRCQPPVVCLQESPASNSSTNCRRQNMDMDSDYGRLNGTRSQFGLEQWQQTVRLRGSGLVLRGSPSGVQPCLHLLALTLVFTWMIPLNSSILRLPSLFQIKGKRSKLLIRQSNLSSCRSDCCHFNSRAKHTKKPYRKIVCLTKMGILMIGRLMGFWSFDNVRWQGTLPGVQPQPRNVVHGRLAHESVERNPGEKVRCYGTDTQSCERAMRSMMRSKTC